MNNTGANQEKVQAEPHPFGSPSVPVALRPTPSSQLLSPPLIPDHDLLRRIGQGSYGEVWLARNVLGEHRAVKIVYRSTFEDDRPFEREFEGIRRFEPISRSHPSQLNILHVGRGGGCFYYVMELADDSNGDCKVDNAESVGPQSNPILQSSPSTPHSYSPRTLKLDLKRRGRLPPAECVEIGLALTTALGHLHGHGLVHRDIKPSNIIFVGGIPKLADIGLVTDVDASRSFVGTEGFLPPEGPGTPQADLYSLGKVLYEMSTGKDRHDFPELPENLRDLPDQEALIELNAVLVKACAAAVRERYESAEELNGDLALLQCGESVKRNRAFKQRLNLGMRVAVAAAVFAILVAGVWPFVRQFTVPVIFTPAEFKAIAVLPFEQKTPSESDPQFGAQMAEELGALLSKVPNVRVLGRASVDALGRATNRDTLARELNLRALVQGQAHKTSKGARLVVEVHDPDKARQIWSGSYERPLAELSAMQMDIASKIAEHAGLKTAEKLHQRAMSQSATNLEARRLYSLGRFLWGKRSEPAVRKAIGHFEEVVQLDPANALGWVALADCYNVLGDWGYSEPTNSFPKAKAFALKALSLDKALPEAHAALGKVADLYDWDNALAEREFKKALALNPGCAVAHQWYAEFLSRMARFDEAIAEMKAALAFDPVSLIINCNVGQMCFDAHQFDQAVLHFRKATDLDPAFPRAHSSLACVYERLGQRDDALRERDNAAKLDGGADRINELMLAGLRSSGIEEGWRQALAMLAQKGIEKATPFERAETAILNSQLGHLDACFQWLEAALSSRSDSLRDLKALPQFDNLRSDPRYPEFLRKVGLEP